MMQARLEFSLFEKPGVVKPIVFPVSFPLRLHRTARTAHARPYVTCGLLFPWLFCMLFILRYETEKLPPLAQRSWLSVLHSAVGCVTLPGSFFHLFIKVPTGLLKMCNTFFLLISFFAHWYYLTKKSSIPVFPFCVHESSRRQCKTTVSRYPSMRSSRGLGCDLAKHFRHIVKRNFMSIRVFTTLYNCEKMLQWMAVNILAALFPNT